MPKLFKGTKEILSLAGGAQNVKALYAGNKLVWGEGEPIEDPIPLNGTLTNKFVFSPDNPTPYVDLIGGVSCYLSGGERTLDNEGVHIGYTKGISTNLELNTYDYVECIFKIGNFTGASNYHIRPLCLGDTRSASDKFAILIYRGSSYYWTSFFNSWQTDPFSRNLHEFSEKKIGIFFKPNGYVDIFIDNQPFYKDFLSNYHKSSENIYNLGTITSNYSSQTDVSCSSFRLFRNCSYKE